MHPAHAFAIDPPATRALADAIGLGHIFASTPTGPMVAHAPVVRVADDLLWFHLANANRLTAHLAGATALISLADNGSYISPDWYADTAGSVPTWNYRAAEAHGTITLLDDAQLAEQVDRMAAAHEPRMGTAWQRSKMEPQRYQAMARAITGFAMHVEHWRGTWKASQNKSAADRATVRTGLIAAGHKASAAWIA
jgi:transcriptional regulator